MEEKTENICVEGKKEATETMFCVPIEETFDVELPKEVMEALHLQTGDSIQFEQDDDGQVYLKKA